MSTSFPIFGEGGRLEGDLGQQSSTTTSTALPPANRGPLPCFEYNDPAKEHERVQAATDNLLRQLMPKRMAAADASKRADTIVRQWTETVTELQGAVARASSLVDRARQSMEYEDASPISRTQRLAALQAQLTEAQEELNAAVEEQTTARATFKRLAGL